MGYFGLQSIIFYGILCTGLTEKTKLSFMSSNSSFTECVRKHDIVTVSSSFLANSNCDGPTYLSCTFTQVNLTSLYTSATFTSCVWTNCQSQNGGGIYLNVTSSSVTLSLNQSEFYSCTSSHRGGGIFVEGIGQLQVQYSLFHACVAGAAADYGGGGIEIHDGGRPLIQETSFLSCQSGSDGAGMGIWSSPFYHEACVLNSRFVGCHAAPFGNDNDGGSLIVWDAIAAICCSNILFVDSLSEYRGGASSYYIYSSAGHHSSIHLFIFCFFKNNVARFRPGNDVYFHNWKPDQPFLHCFSLTPTDRIYPNGKDDNWLPHGTS